MAPRPFPWPRPSKFDWRQMAARDAHIFEQVDLADYGVRKVFVGPGVAVMYSADGQPALCFTVEEALSFVGVGVVIDLGGKVFLEPWDAPVGAPKTSAMDAARSRARECLDAAWGALPTTGQVAQGYFGVGKTINETRADYELPELDINAPMPIPPPGVDVLK